MKESVKMWVEALRSGKYKQGIGRLKDGNKYCCLGVACELYNSKHERKVLIGNQETLSRELAVVRYWLELRTPAGDYELECLAAQNDYRVSFNDIADIIESNPKGLFEELK